MSINDQELDRRLQSLPRTAAEVPDWPTVEARLERPVHGRPWMTGVAAALCLGVVTWLLMHGGSGSQPVSVAAAVIEAEVGAMQRLEPESDLVERVARSPDWRQAWHDNQQAIGELEEALERNPENTLLLDFLRRARLRQSELLQQAQAIGPVVHNWRT